MKSPVRFRRDAHGHVLEVHIAPCGEAPLSITKSRHEIKVETHFLVRRAGLEQFFQLGILIDRAHGFNEAGPVRGVQELGLAMLLHQRNNDQLVVDALAVVPFLQAIGGEVEQVLSLHVVNAGLRAKGFETGKDRPVGAQGPQRAVVLDVFGIVVERRGDSDAFRFRLRRRLRRDDAIAHGGKFRLFAERWTVSISLKL